MPSPPPTQSATEDVRSLLMGGRYVISQDDGSWRLKPGFLPSILAVSVIWISSTIMLMLLTEASRAFRSDVLQAPAGRGFTDLVLYAIPTLIWPIAFVLQAVFWYRKPPILVVDEHNVRVTRFDARIPKSSVLGVGLIRIRDRLDSKLAFRSVLCIASRSGHEFMALTPVGAFVNWLTPISQYVRGITSELNCADLGVLELDPELWKEDREVLPLGSYLMYERVKQLGILPPPLDRDSD